jgi:hypothetical protein
VNIADRDNALDSIERILSRDGRKARPEQEER